MGAKTSRGQQIIAATEEAFELLENCQARYPIMSFHYCRMYENRLNRLRFQYKVITKNLDQVIASNQLSAMYN